MKLLISIFVMMAIVILIQFGMIVVYNFQLDRTLDLAKQATDITKDSQKHLETLINTIVEANKCPEQATTTPIQ